MAALKGHMAHGDLSSKSISAHAHNLPLHIKNVTHIDMTSVVKIIDPEAEESFKDACVLFDELALRKYVDELKNLHWLVKNHRASLQGGDIDHLLSKGIIEPSEGQPAAFVNVFTEVEHAKVEHAKVEHAKVEHAKVEHGKVEHAKVEHAKVEHAKARRRLITETLLNRVMNDPTMIGLASANDISDAVVSPNWYVLVRVPCKLIFNGISVRNPAGKLNIPKQVPIVLSSTGRTGSNSCVSLSPSDLARDVLSSAGRGLA